LTEEQVTAETDKSNMLLASDLHQYFRWRDRRYSHRSICRHVPPALRSVQELDGGNGRRPATTFFDGDYSEVLGILPFAVLAVILYLVGPRIMDSW